MIYDTLKPFTKDIKSLIQETWKDNPYLEIIPPLPFLKKTTSHLEVDHTDGIGTKGWFHWRRRTFKEAAQDAFAMSYNDLIMAGSAPYKMQVHLMLPQEDHEAINALMRSLTELALKYKIAITGGETAFLNTLDGLEVGITMTGAVLYPPQEIAPGDLLVGLKSSGLHSNGFTLIRELFDSEDWITTPTKIYELMGLPMQHITSGGIYKLHRLLDPFGAELISWDFPYPFNQINLPREKMLRTFNCGYGMILAVSPAKLNIPKGDIIGKVVEKSGIVWK